MMGTVKKYAPFFLSAMLMCVVLFIIYPHYQYYIDPDGTSYLTIAQRYASGDYHTAINGYWSPWACWLTALFIKAGMAAIPASVVVNAMGALGFLYISQSFFVKFGVMRKLQWILCVTLAFFLCYAVFWQSFDDLWECFFLLSTLRLLLTDGFKDKPVLWVCCGLVGALAYFAKAYSFPFFILNTACCVWFIVKGDKVQWLKIGTVAVGIMVLCSLPWIWLLHEKYGMWTTSTAGSLNMSWYLVGHPHYKAGIDLLLPPTYKDSPYYWEDPYFANGDTPHFWNSFHLLGLQVLRVGQNVYRFLLSTLALSVFFPVITGITIASFFSKKLKVFFPGNLKIVAISFLLFPLGYVLINFESRYIWYMLPLGMMIGALLMQRYMKGIALPILLALFFLVWPMINLSLMRDEGKEDHDIAMELKQMHIQGSFAISPLSFNDQSIERIAYFSGCTLYSTNKLKEYSDAKMLAELRRYHVKYFFASGMYAKYVSITDEQGKLFPELTHGQLSNHIRVYLINP